jgi:hypothetical protein
MLQESDPVLYGTQPRRTAYIRYDPEALAMDLETLRDRARFV